MLVLSTEPFLSNIREPRNEFFKLFNFTSAIGKFCNDNTTQAKKCIVKNGGHVE